MQAHHELRVAPVTFRNRIDDCLVLEHLRRAFGGSTDSEQALGEVGYAGCQVIQGAISRAIVQRPVESGVALQEGAVIVRAFIDQAAPRTDDLSQLERLLVRDTLGSQTGPVALEDGRWNTSSACASSTSETQQR